MATDTFTLQSIHATLGALEIGLLACMFLLGLSTAQAYIYYNRFPLDHWKIKTLVSPNYVICNSIFASFLHLGCFSHVRQMRAAFRRNDSPAVSSLGPWNGLIVSASHILCLIDTAVWTYGRARHNVDQFENIHYLLLCCFIDSSGTF
jgi:hypothetical protein